MKVDVELTHPARACRGVMTGIELEHCAIKAATPGRLTLDTQRPDCDQVGNPGCWFRICGAAAAAGHPVEIFHEARPI